MATKMGHGESEEMLKLKSIWYAYQIMLSISRIQCHKPNLKRTTRLKMAAGKRFHYYNISEIKKCNNFSNLKPFLGHVCIKLFTT